MPQGKVTLSLLPRHFRFLSERFEYFQCRFMVAHEHLFYLKKYFVLEVKESNLFLTFVQPHNSYQSESLPGNQTESLADLVTESH